MIQVGNCPTFFRHLRVRFGDIALAPLRDYVEVIDGGASRAPYSRQLAYMTSFNNYQGKGKKYSLNPFYNG